MTSIETRLSLGGIEPDLEVVQDEPYHSEEIG